jgi:uncharacterized protein
MMTHPAPQTPYHRLARTATHRWWRAPLGTAFILAAGVVLMLFVYAAFTTAAVILGRPDGPDGMPAPGELGELALSFLAIAVLLPAVLAAARWVQRRPAGSLSSVTGRLRWGWLLTCVPVAVVAIVLVLGVAMILPAPAEETGGSAGWGPFVAATAVLLLVVPVQAAAEEYLMRGWVLQAFGTVLRGPWIPIAVQAVIFAALHGWGTPWGFADLVVFGAVAGWLTVRTGGLEAAIALHVVNNLLGSVLLAAYGDLAQTETAADLPWPMVALDVPILVAYAVVVAWLARRRGLATVTPQPPARPAFPVVPPAVRALSL